MSKYKFQINCKIQKSILSLVMCVSVCFFGSVGAFSFKNDYYLKVEDLNNITLPLYCGNDYDIKLEKMGESISSTVEELFQEKIKNSDEDNIVATIKCTLANSNTNNNIKFGIFTDDRCPICKDNSELISKNCVHMYSNTWASLKLTLEANNIPEDKILVMAAVPIVDGPRIKINEYPCVLTWGNECIHSDEEMSNNRGIITSILSKQGESQTIPYEVAPGDHLEFFVFVLSKTTPIVDSFGKEIGLLQDFNKIFKPKKLNFSINSVNKEEKIYTNDKNTEIFDLNKKVNEMSERINKLSNLKLNYDDSKLEERILKLENVVLKLQEENVKTNHWINELYFLCLKCEKEIDNLKLNCDNKLSCVQEKNNMAIFDLEKKLNYLFNFIHEYRKENPFDSSNYMRDYKNKYFY